MVLKSRFIEHFATTSISPRSIAWLIQQNEWERFETIVKYNCAMLGGYYNAIIPVTEQQTLSQQYEDFLISYDPDFVVLGPRMSDLRTYLSQLPYSPFDILFWTTAREMLAIDPDDPNPTKSAPPSLEVLFSEDPLRDFPLFREPDESFPDTSRLALVACGDIQEGTAYRNLFLHRKFSKRFPLNNTVEILETCYQHQHFKFGMHSPISLTASYRANAPNVNRVPFGRNKNVPQSIMLVSNAFGLDEAVLFWNLRASGRFVFWLPLLQLEQEFEVVAEWLKMKLNSQLSASKKRLLGGHPIPWVQRALAVVFSSEIDNAQIQNIRANLQKTFSKNFGIFQIMDRKDIITYDYTRPMIAEDQTLITERGAQRAFIPRFSLQEYSGYLVIKVASKDLMFPQDDSFISNLISSERLEVYDRSRTYISRPLGMHIPKFRVGKDHYLRIQIGSDSSIDFNKPSISQIYSGLFKAAGFSRVEQSNTARYHMNFVDRAGGIREAARYLAKQPYRNLFEVLADNTAKKKPGWILERPDKRRALHHLDLMGVLEKAIPVETRKYFDTISDHLPDEAIELLEKRLLERGFLLKCTSCSSNAWYPVQHVGEGFECYRCSKSQVYRSNPIWLYKLPEVIFQGFKDNMQVPLLALNYLRSQSRHNFDWQPDSNIYWVEGDKEQHRNVDIICLCDGKLYIGEAKSSDEIPSDQFSFYEQLCRRVKVNGVIFATSKKKWRPNTLERLADLQRRFTGEIITLTQEELYKIRAWPVG